MKKTSFKALALISVLSCSLALSGCSFVFRVLEEALEDSERIIPSSNANFDVDKVDINGKTIIQKTILIHLMKLKEKGKKPQKERERDGVMMKRFDEYHLSKHFMNL